MLNSQGVFSEVFKATRPNPVKEDLTEPSPAKGNQEIPEDLIKSRNKGRKM
jgi:hypothetical protein